MAALKICLVTAFLLVLVEGGTVKYYNSQAAANRVARILKKVPSSEQNDFLRYHINKGYELLEEAEGSRPSLSYNISDQDSLLLYKYYATNNRIEDTKQIESLNTIICWKDKCIDISDPGVHP